MDATIQALPYPNKESNVSFISFSDKLLPIGDAKEAERVKNNISLAIRGAVARGRLHFFCNATTQCDMLFMRQVYAQRLVTPEIKLIACRVYPDQFVSASGGGAAELIALADDQTALFTGAKKLKLHRLYQKYLVQHSAEIFCCIQSGNLSRSFVYNRCMDCGVPIYNCYVSPEKPAQTTGALPWAYRMTDILLRRLRSERKYQALKTERDSRYETLWQQADLPLRHALADYLDAVNQVETYTLRFFRMEGALMIGCMLEDREK